MYISCPAVERSTIETGGGTALDLTDFPIVA